MWKLDYKESWVLKNWCFWTVVLEKTLESPLDCKEIQPVHSKGDQSWVFIGRTDVEAETPILWPPNGKSWLIGKDPHAGKIEGKWSRERQRMRRLDSVTDQMDMNLSKLGASPVAWLVKNLPARQETWVRFLGREDPLEKETATHSSLLAWRIPWTEEPGALQFMALQS